MFDKSNLSVDNQLTKERVRVLVESATPQQKRDIVSTLKLTDSSIEYVYATGEINVFVTTLVSRTLNVSPYYLTGETDIPGEYSKEDVDSFLIVKGYSFVIDEEPR